MLSVEETGGIVSIITQVIICSLVGGVLSLVGGLLLAMNKHHARLAEYATAFAAGALLIAAFLDLLPEALEDEPNASLVLISTLFGLIVFFMLEGALKWFHSHKTSTRQSSKEVAPMVPMIIIGDTIHNFIDGVAIASGFLISPLSGIVVTLAVTAHEVPQEIGDFGVMLNSGMKRSKVILINGLSALATTVSAIIFYIIGESVEISFAPLLGLVAGFFIYIALSDIIPTIHREKSKLVALKKSLVLLMGAVLVGVAIVALHDVAHEHHHHTDAVCEEEEHEHHDITEE
ncbi:MAG: ZIP family metal transporter [Candidatus Nomurabacteria bacterium]|jgi:zinc and cadmium transporter|nr:ZIP family metal transporter [Candidatus Nomurabacteria bacterium]